MWIKRIIQPNRLPPTRALLTATFSKCLESPLNDAAEIPEKKNNKNAASRLIKIPQVWQSGAFFPLCKCSIYKHNNHNNTHDSWSVFQHMFHLWPLIKQSATSSCNDFSSWLVCKTSQLGLERARQGILDEPQTSCFRPQFTTMKYHILQNKRYENPLCKLSKINKPGFFRGLWTFNECDNRRTEGKKMICLGMKRNSKWSRTTWLPVMNYSQVFFFTLAVQKNNLSQLSFEWKVTIPGTSCKLALLLRTVDSRTWSHLRGNTRHQNPDGKTWKLQVFFVAIFCSFGTPNSLPCAVTTEPTWMPLVFNFRKEDLSSTTCQSGHISGHEDGEDNFCWVVKWNFSESKLVLQSCETLALFFK